MSRSLKDIARRLKLAQDALGLSGAQIARDTSISANEWSQYLNPEKYKRKIGTDHVLELKDEYGITLEWVYDDDISSLPDRLASKIRKLAA